MVQKTKNYITQYKALFSFSWVLLYLIFPTWINLHLYFTESGFPISFPIARTFAILLLIIYFSISVYLINRYFNALGLDKPLFMRVTGWSEHIRNNSGLIIICCLSAVLHIYPLSLDLVVLGGGEIPYILHPVSIYDSLNSYWYGISDIPVQYLFWSIIVLVVLAVRQKKMVRFISDYATERFSRYSTNNLTALFSLSIIFILFSIYAYLFPYNPWYEALPLLRYPPVSKFIYLINYYAFGVSHTGPRIVQLMFYILGAVYLYRTINLFRGKETALLGTSVYLFSPIIFSYASRAAFASGTVFFMILISFYFLKFIKDEENRDLVLTAYFIGVGFMYKRVLLVMFIICFIYLVFSKIRKRDWHSFIHIKILLLSLISVLPFMMIGRYTGLNFYAPELSNLLSFDFMFSVIQSQISVFISVLFLFSIVFVLFKRDDLSLFYLYFFITYYVFFTIGGASASQRYSMAFYPAIAVLLAQFISGITQHLRYKHIFKLTFAILTLYLILLCLVPRTTSSLVTYKYQDFESQYYPVDEATDWIISSTGSDDKVLWLFIPDYEFYVERIYASRDDINKERFISFSIAMAEEIVYPIQNLKEFCYANRISYIAFLFSENSSYPVTQSDKEIMKYLKENIDDEFTEIRKFNYEDNYIFMYKLKDYT